MEKTGTIQAAKALVYEIKEKNDYFIADTNLIMGDEKYVFKIKDLDAEDRPREKLIKNGPDALSTKELLSVILNTGTKKEDVAAMTARIIKEYGEKNIFNQKDPKIMERELQIPLAKACQIVACFELGRRFLKEDKSRSAVVRTAKQVFEYLKDMRELPKEQLRGIYLNSHYRIIHDEVISVGSLTANIVHPREVFRPALEHSAAAVIIAHNHPSGSVKPTESDIEITKQLKRAGEILGVELLDHVIIAKSKYFSIKIN